MINICLSPSAILPLVKVVLIKDAIILLRTTGCVIAHLSELEIRGRATAAFPNQLKSEVVIPVVCIVIKPG